MKTNYYNNIDYNINTDFTVKFVNKNSKSAALKLLNIYRSLISQKKQSILSQCYDFSPLSIATKFRLDKYLNLENHKEIDNFEDPTLDDFLMLKAFAKRKPNPKGNHKVDNEIYTYSMSKTRELLYLCSKAKISPTVIVNLEEIDIYNPIYNPDNIKQVVNDMRIDYITIKI